MTCPYSLWNLRNRLWITKPQLRVKQICLQDIILNFSNNKNESWKTVRLTRFQKPQLQSISIFFKFVHPCLFLYFWILVRFSVFFMFQSIWWQFWYMKSSASESKPFHSRSQGEMPGRARRKERLSSSKLKQAFLIDSDAELFMNLIQRMRFSSWKFGVWIGPKSQSIKKISRQTESWFLRLLPGGYLNKRSKNISKMKVIYFELILL